jgi:hypothetical protein
VASSYGSDGAGGETENHSLPHVETPAVVVDVSGVLEGWTKALFLEDWEGGNVGRPRDTAGLVYNLVMTLFLSIYIYSCGWQPPRCGHLHCSPWSPPLT